MKIWTYRRTFRIGEIDGRVDVAAMLDGLRSTLFIDGRPLATDATPAAGDEAVRTHHLAATLDDGRQIDVAAGYNSWVSCGIAVRLDGALVHESHPGRPIAYPPAMARMVTARGKDGTVAYDPDILTRNKVPLLVDLLLGLLFFVVAKFVNLQTAALVGAGAGLALIVVQRFVKTDLIGGMALFGVVMLLLSAGFAVAFADDEIIKQRSTILGLVGAALFLVDGLLGGKRLGQGMARYIAYRDIDPQRLALGMAGTGATLALLNFSAARVLTTNQWLFYTTFADVPVSMALVYAAIRYARSRPMPAAPAVA